MLDLHGAFTAIVTPFNRDGSKVDFARLGEQIRFQAEGRVTGVVACGTTGESPTLTEDEHRAVVERAVEIGKPLGLIVIAGAGSNNTAYAIHLQKVAKDAGADCGLQVNPYYNKPSQEGLYRHFMAIADAVDLPIMLYNIPGRTAVALSPDTVARLAQHENIVANKEATGSLDSASEIIMKCRDSLQLLSGDDTMTLSFASVGAVGVVSVVSNILPRETSELCAAFNRGDWEEARRLHYALFAISKGLLSLDTNPIPIKTAMNVLGRDSGSLRLPMCEPTDAVVKKIESLVKSLKHERAAV
jgi:4-hydroxy-tetrahydrodipicolinate synthase